MKPMVFSRYYSLPHRVAHHVLTGGGILVSGLLLYAFMPVSLGGKNFLMFAALVHATSRFLRVPFFFLRNKDAHWQRICAHLAEILQLTVMGAWLGLTKLDGEMQMLFFGIIGMLASKHLFPLVDHLRSLRRSSVMGRRLVRTSAIVVDFEERLRIAS